MKKNSGKLKFGADVPYTFRVHQKKIPITLGTAKIHNDGFGAKLIKNLLYK